MEKRIIVTDKAPQPVANYSQAIAVGDLLFTSGQGPRNPNTGQVVSGNMQEQTEQTLENLRAILEAGGSSLNDVVKLCVFLADVNLFPEFENIYNKYFGNILPTRTTVQAKLVRKDMLVEIDAIAHVTDRNVFKSRKATT